MFCFHNPLYVFDSAIYCLAARVVLYCRFVEVRLEAIG